MHTILRLPLKACIRIVFNFSWDPLVSEERLKTMACSRKIFRNANKSFYCEIEIVFILLLVVTIRAEVTANLRRNFKVAFSVYFLSLGKLNLNLRLENYTNETIKALTRA